MAGLRLTRSRLIIAIRRDLVVAVLSQRRLSIAGSTGSFSRAALLARMAEGRLLSYQTRGRERVGRGPLIICLDASASMTATITGNDLGVSAADPSREAWAKAVTLALVDHAAHTVPPREVIVIRFSTDIDSVHHFPADRRPTVEEILALAEAWQSGGGPRRARARPAPLVDVGHDRPHGTNPATRPGRSPPGRSRSTHA